MKNRTWNKRFCPSIQSKRGILGFKLVERMKLENDPQVEELMFIELNGTVIEIFSIKNPAPISKEEWQVGVPMVALEFEDLDKAIEYLESKGIEVSHEEKSPIAEIKDSDGISVEMFQHD